MKLSYAATVFLLSAGPPRPSNLIFFPIKPGHWEHGRKVKGKAGFCSAIAPSEASLSLRSS
jgi:hypothetical protein